MNSERRGGDQMVGNILESNMVTVCGKVVTEIEFSHEVYGEGFYSFLLEVPRLSDSFDYIPVTISERLVNKDKLIVGTIVEVDGQFRSYNSYTNEGNKLLLTVFARDISFLEDIRQSKNPNQIYLNGYVCKKTDIHL